VTVVSVHSVPGSVDQVKRWDELKFQYPQASKATDGAWFYGALRDDDIPLRASSLERLIDALVRRG
jgi:hypothetical protein